MLLKSQRLNLRTNFRWVASGKSLSSQNFKLFYRLGDNQNPLIGVSLVSAQFKKANLRNKAKRIMFDQAKVLYSKLHKNLNLVIMPKTQVLSLPKEQLDQEFSNAISSLKID